MPPPEIWEVIKTGGWALSPLLFWLWWRSDTERQALQGKYETMAERTIEAMTEVSNAVKTIDRLFSGGRNPP